MTFQTMNEYQDTQVCSENEDEYRGQSMFSTLPSKALLTSRTVRDSLPPLKQVAKPMVSVSSSYESTSQLLSKKSRNTGPQPFLTQSLPSASYRSLNFLNSSL